MARRRRRGGAGINAAAKTLNRCMQREKQRQKLSIGKPFCYFGSIIIAILALSPQADGNLSSSQKKSLVAQGELT